MYVDTCLYARTHNHVYMNTQTSKNVHTYVRMYVHTQYTFVHTTILLVFIGELRGKAWREKMEEEESIPP